MASIRWEPKALATAQVDTVTVANTWAQGDTVTLTINTKSLVVTIGTLVTTAQVATTIQQAWENATLTDTDASFTPARGGQDILEHAEITATVSGSVVTLTHDTRGRPFILTVTETTAGDGTATEATATSATGPNHVDNVNNWSGGALPASDDDVFIDNTDVSLLYALDGLTFSGDPLDSLTIGANFTGDIGLPKTTAAGYTEYLPDFLALDATNKTPAMPILIGNGEGPGSGRIKLDAGSTAAEFEIEETGTSPEFGLQAVILKGTHATLNTLDVQGGSVGVAVFGAETSVITTARVSNAEVEFGQGCVVATLNVEGATVNLRENATTITLSSGTLNCFESMTVGTMNHSGGLLNYNSSGTVSTFNLGGPTGPTVDYTGDNNARTITSLTVNGPFLIRDPQRTVTYSGIVIGADLDSLSGT